MKILVRLPNWLGDAIMASYALEILRQAFKEVQFYLVGSKVAIELFKTQNFKNTTLLVDNTKCGGILSRILKTRQFAKKIPPCDIAITLQNNFPSALLLYFNNAAFKIGFSANCRRIFLDSSPKKPQNLHEAMRYATLIFKALEAFKKEIPQIKPKLYLNPINVESQILPLDFKGVKLLGVNAGAAFGSAKRWEVESFAKVAEHFLNKNFKILLFGIDSEREINEAILEKITESLKSGILNLCGKTNLSNLLQILPHLRLFLTNDSGPMHLASALNVKTLALFGPTRDDETSPFNAKNSRIISLKTLGIPLKCAPCMKRSCPLSRDSKDYHACMKNLSVKAVISELEAMLMEEI
ncbi:MAG: lipopolysaccharide heptosyltransferase II [Helicobacter sp.]|nr:lipopolysaccharide heptosyltransferase II [Helicobacter sp.]